MSGRLDACPECGESLQGGPIPVESQHLYGATHWRREIGMEIRGAYDGVMYWFCPVCDYAWPRNFGSEQLDMLSAEYADKHNAKKVSTNA